jgi:hypothetical protein
MPDHVHNSTFIGSAKLSSWSMFVQPVIAGKQENPEKVE